MPLLQTPDFQTCHISEYPSMDSQTIPAVEVRYWISSTIESLIMFVKGQFSVNDLSGPVGIIDVIGDSYEEAKEEGAVMVWMQMLYWAILLSANPVSYTHLQAFFTLSLGIGALAIFGSYIGKERKLTGEAVNILVLDTFVALTAGLIIFPACSAFGVDPGEGPG